MKLKKNGFSLLEVLVAVGIMSIIMAGMITLLTGQQREMRSLSEKLSALDLEKIVIAQSAKEDICGKYMADNPTVFTFTGASFPPINDIIIPTLYLGASSTSKLVEVGHTLTGGNFNVSNIRLTNIIGENNSYNGFLKISFQGGIRQYTDATISVKLSTIKTASNEIQITGCPGINVIPQTGRRLFFGGGFGGGYAGYPTYNNPATGNLSCPSGYAEVHVLGTSGMDYQATLCIRDTLDTLTPEPTQYYAFGGMYSLTHINPYTGGLTCPSGYTKTPILGSSGIDYELNMCWKSLGSEAPNDANSMPFGGFVGTVAAYPVPNPLTGTRSCPAGFKSSDVYGYSGVDYSVSVCHKP